MIQIQAGGHAFSLNLDVEAENTRRRVGNAALILSVVKVEVDKVYHLLTAQGMHDEAADVWEASKALQDALEKVEGREQKQPGTGS